jgi:Flp pilus assembly protein TadB
MKGFRPGKEPPELRKRRAKQQFGDVNPAQERLIEAFAGRTPDEARALIRRWQIGLLATAVVLAVVGLLLYAWSVIAAIIVHVLAGLVLLIWFRVRRQRSDLEAMADAISGGGPGRGRRKR